MFAEPKATDKLQGLTPDWDRHGSAAIIEPVTICFNCSTNNISDLI